MKTPRPAPLNNLRWPAPPTWLKLFLLLSWLHMLWFTSGYVSFDGPLDYQLFHVSAWLLYSALYLLPVLLLTWPLCRFARSGQAMAMISSLACLLLIDADRMIYGLYAFHINGFVLNLVFTPGGLESLGNGSQTYISLALLAARTLIIQLAALLLALRAGGRIGNHRLRVGRGLAIGLALFLMQGTVHGISDINKNGAVLETAHAYPFFQTIRFRTLAARIGFAAKPRTKEIQATVDNSRLNYPLQPIQFDKMARPPNILIVVAESLRWDQLNPEIMPNSWAFAQRHQHFTAHHSTGNGTRESLFGLFYGLYGSYWKNFLNARRGPLLVDRLLALDYDLDIRTSAKFTYPEFDKTIFAEVPVAQLREQERSMPPWQKDQQNTSELLDFLARRDGEKPFFGFFFMESTHAGYTFPADNAPRTPYAGELDYSRLNKPDLERDRLAMFNRYGNAAHWLDVQLGRLYRQLEQQQLLDNTIVIVTGDHGEEFMERGSWGHNSTFVDQQTRVPLIVAMPGQPAGQIERITSHMDIATTLLQTLGAQNDPGDYSLGQNLFDASPRPFITLSDWHSIAVLTADIKYRIPYLNRGQSWEPTAPDDAPLAASAMPGLIAANRGLILEAMANCTRFSSRAGAEQPAVAGQHRGPGPLPQVSSLMEGE